MRFHYLNCNKSENISTIPEKLHHLTTDLKVNLSSIKVAQDIRNIHDLRLVFSNYVENDVVIVNTIDSIGDQPNIINLNLEYCIKNRIFIICLDIHGDEMISKLVDYKQLLEIGKKNSSLPIDYNPLKELEIYNHQLLHIMKWCAEKYSEEFFLSKYKLNLRKAENKLKELGRPKKYAPDSKDPKGREMYYNVLKMHKEGIRVTQISRLTGLTRNTVYSIIDRVNNEIDNS